MKEEEEEEQKEATVAAGGRNRTKIAQPTHSCLRMDSAFR